MVEPARAKLEEWLTGEIDDYEKEIIDLEKRLNEAKENLRILRFHLRLVHTGHTPKHNTQYVALQKTSVTSTQESDSNSNTKAMNGGLHTVGNNELLERRPKDLLKPRYSNMTLLEVAQEILDSQKRVMSIDDIARVAFSLASGDEYERAKSSLAAELRRGAKEGKWRQAERGKFMSLDADLPELPDEIVRASLIDKAWQLAELE